MNERTKKDSHPLLELAKDFTENGTDRSSLKIGGTFYEIATHFDPKGRQSVLDQFKALILANDPV